MRSRRPMGEGAPTAAIRPQGVVYRDAADVAGQLAAEEGVAALVAEACQEVIAAAEQGQPYDTATVYRFAAGLAYRSRRMVAAQIGMAESGWTGIVDVTAPTALLARLQDALAQVMAQAGATSDWNEDVFAQVGRDVTLAVVAVLRPEWLEPDERKEQ